MTVAQQIKSRIDMLEPSQQTTLLKIIESFEPGPKPIPTKKRRASAAEVDAAINEAAGIWKMRADLPRNAVTASRLLRRHLKSPRYAKSKRSREAEIDSALRGIAGIWKDRSDLPKDPVQAVKVLRSRMRSREAACLMSSSMPPF